MLQQTKEKPQKRAKQSKKRRGAGEEEGVGTEAACQLLCLPTKTRMKSGSKGQREEER